MELLDELYLSENNKAGPYFVLGLLRGAPQLRVLDLSGCEPEKGGLTDARMGKITSAFSALPNTLEVLYFTHNSLSGEDLGALLEACESRQIRLRRLFLRSNEVKALGATHLAEKFGELEELDLRSNRVSADGIRRLCDAAAKKNGVRVLRLGFNESLGNVAWTKTVKVTDGFATGSQGTRSVPTAQSAAPALRDLICAGRIAILDLPAAGLNTHDAVRCLTDGLRCRPSRSSTQCGG